MRQNDLLEALRRRPFQPFAIHLSDGTVYAITHPEVVMLGPSAAMIFFPPPDKAPPAYERSETVALSHIVRLVPGEPKSPATSPA